MILPCFNSAPVIITIVSLVDVSIKGVYPIRIEQKEKAVNQKGGKKKEKKEKKKGKHSPVQ